MKTSLFHGIMILLKIAKDLSRADIQDFGHGEDRLLEK
jgi:hypothetical protein